MLREMTEYDKVNFMRASLNTLEGRVALLRECRKDPQQVLRDLGKAQESFVLDEVTVSWMRAFIELEEEDSANLVRN